MVMFRNLFVKNSEGQSNAIHNVDSSISVATFKQFVFEKMGVPVEHQHLIAGTKPLRDELCLNDYNIHDAQTLTLVIRLRGGASAEGVPEGGAATEEDSAYQNLTVNQNVRFGVAVKTTCEVCYNDDENDWRFKLHCNHIICACALKNRIKSTAESFGLAILCPMTGCGQELEYNDISPYARMLEEEQKTWEEKLGKAIVHASPNMCICPHCTGYLMKEYPDSKVKCSLCNGAAFCFVCLKDWTHGNRVCGNDGCGGPNAHKINALENCPTKTISYVTNCPEIRLCPKCDMLIKHETACKHMTCRRENHGCGYEFCFACLKPWTGAGACNLSTICTAAPTQTLRAA